MKELKTRKDFKSLKRGEKIHKVYSDKERGFRVVGTMPKSENYLILSDGEHLEHLYLHVDDEKFELYFDKSNMWFIGVYNSNQIGQSMLKNLERRIQIVKDVYLKN